MSHLFHTSTDTFASRAASFISTNPSGGNSAAALRISSRSRSTSATG
jgi:hypothetical protein